MGCGVVPGNVYALSGCHCEPHSSSIKTSILNWHDRLLKGKKTRVVSIGAPAYRRTIERRAAASAKA